MLLIGANGFVGGHLRDAATAAGLQVISADRNGDAAAGGIVCDLRDPASVAACLEAARPDLVVNMAGAASVAESWKDPAATFDLNATGALNLLEAVAAVVPEAHVLCVSSADVYGEPRDDRLPFSESLTLEPVSPYGASKAAMEAICGQYARGRGMRIATIRPFNQIGPGQAGKYAASGFARQIAEAEARGARSVEMSVGNLDASRDFTDVRDTARAFTEVSARGLTGVYNLCSGSPLGLEALVRAMADATELPVDVRVDPALRRPADPSVVYGDPSRLHEAIGWEPRIPLEQTVADLLDWWRRRLVAAAT